MHEPPRWRRYLRFWGPDVAADVDDEIRFHLEERERELLASGLDPAAAREEALARFGDPESVAHWLRRHDTRRLRRSRRIETMSELLHDARYALRQLRAQPGFTLAVVLVLALGIGLTTAVWSVFDAALLRPLPYPEPERLVAVRDLQETDEVPASYPEYLDWKQETAVFAEAGAYFTTTIALTGQGEPEMLRVARMTANLPVLLGAEPRIGRSFAPGEDAPGADRVVLLHENLWRRRFAADPGLIGSSITLADESYAVIGIVPAGRRSTLPVAVAAGRTHELWLPLRLEEAEAPRGLHFLNVLARLRPELDPVLAEERIQSLASRLQEAEVTDHGIRLLALDRLVIGESRPLLFALAGAVSMVLLIACTNVANLLLARSAARRREIALRAALGAARGRLVRQLLVESVLLSLLGGAAGTLVAWGVVTGLRALEPGSVPRLAEAAIDLRMLSVTLALSLATGILFGLLPALRASRTDLAAVMKEGTRGAGLGPSRQRLRNALIVAEVALSFALLIGAGLLLRSLDRLLTVDKGFDAERVVSGYLLLPESRYPDADRQLALYRELRETVAALPGVRAAAYVNNLPLDGGVNGSVRIEGREFPPGEEPFSEKRIASPGYFDVLRTPLLAGRVFEERDTAGAPAVVVVNQAFAQRWFPAESALGKRVDFSWGTTGFQEIVGVVGDVRERALHLPAAPTLYIPLEQRPADDAHLLVRTTVEPSSLVPALRRAVSELDPDLPLAEVRTLEDVMAGGLAQRRLALSLFGVFAGLALALAALGLYAVISYTVLQRRQEIGIRIALGARSPQVIGSVLGQALMLCAAGTAIGALAAIALGRLLSALLFGIEATDPATFAGVALVLASMALLASALPARRAARLDPVTALRSE